MRSLFIILTLYHFSAYSQGFESFNEADKFGIRYNNTPITKAKFDSLAFQDDSVATAYRKKRVYFLNTAGEKIYKTKIDRAETFSSGTAILKKKGSYGAINRDGDIHVPIRSTRRPEKLGVMVAVEYGEDFWTFYDLYGRFGLVERFADSIKFINGWVIVYTNTTRNYHYKDKRFLRKDKVVNGTLDYPAVSAYQGLTAKCMAYKALDCRVIEDYLVVQENNTTTVVHNHENGKIISGPFKEVIINKNTIYGLTDTIQFYHNLVIYSKTGTPLTDDLGLVAIIDNNRSIFEKDSLQFIGDEFGKPLSPFADGFGSLYNGLRIMYKNGRYTYMNDSTYELMPLSWPVIVQKVNTRHSTFNAGRFVGTKLKNFVRRIGNFGRILIGAKTKQLETYNWSTYFEENVEMVEYGRPFYNDYAIVCYYDQADSNSSKPIMLSNKNDLRYNYVHTSGKLLNDNKYIKCREFRNGKAWVYDGYWHIIDTTGIELPEMKFNQMKEDENGYFIVKQEFNYGIVDPYMNLVVPCKYGYLKFKDNHYYEFSGDQRVVYEIPVDE
ncbi:MAG: WG repeat-containing protein [Crocinitomicaceae bacterium]|nr:WG repeat-containing protein [Crocinitomicaceae bacterium]